MIGTKLKGSCPKRTEPAHSHKNKSIPTWEERHLMTLSAPPQDQPASTQVTVMPDAWAHWLSRCISPCIQSSRHLHTFWHCCVYCVCTALSQLVLCNIPNSLMTAVPLRWPILCSSDCSGRSSCEVLLGPVWLGCSVLLVSGEAFHSCE